MRGLCDCVLSCVCKVTYVHVRMYAHVGFIGALIPNEHKIHMRPLMLLMCLVCSAPTNSLIRVEYQCSSAHTSMTIFDGSL